MFGIYTDLGLDYINPWVIVSIFLVIVIGFYLLRSFALFTMAKNSEDKKINRLDYLAFIPCAWVYLAVCLAERILFFGKEIKGFGIIIVIIFSVAKISSLIFNYLRYMPLISYCLTGGEVLLNLTDYTTNVYLYDQNFITAVALNPYKNIASMENILSILSLIIRIFEFVSSILMLFLYNALFKRYWPRHITSGVIWSFFGLFPIFVFAIRKNKPIDYNEYITSQYKAFYYNANNNNYQNTNNFNNQNNTSNDDPFENLSNNTQNNNTSNGKDDDPFSEFDKKN